VANDAVLRALQEAQREAKGQNSATVSVQDQPKVVIYPAGPMPASSDFRWTNLGEDIALKPGCYTPTLVHQTKSMSMFLNLPWQQQKTITFDYTGVLPLGADTRLKVVVAEAKPGISSA